MNGQRLIMRTTIIILICTKVNNKLLIDNYLYSDGDFDKVIYETHYSRPTYKVGEFLCEEDKKNEKKTQKIIQY